MTKPNQVKIGNEHFKTWLIKFDPAVRVEKMSEIAKIQASAGVTGPSIKESLAQLSRRCKVMLIRLTEEEIKRYTARKTVTNLVDPKRETEHKYTTSETSKGKKPSGAVSKLDKCNKLTFVNKKSIKEVREKNSTSSSLTALDRQESLKENKPSMNIIHKKGLENTKNKLKERYKELFGEDFDDNVKRKSIVNCSHNISDNKGSNYSSTTVNVNIYNSPLEISADTSTCINRKKRTESTVVSDIANKQQQTNKRLRIDVSLPQNTSGIFQAEKRSTKKSKTNTCIMSYKSRKRKPRSKSKSNTVPTNLKIHQNEMNKSVVLALQNDNGEEDPVKELWKIFGMESPTDRSENIIKSYPQSLQNSNVTNKEGNILKSDEEFLRRYPVIGQTVDITDESKKAPFSQLLVSINKDKIINKEVSHNSCLKELGELSADSSFNSENSNPGPVCKISETFSLAVTSQDHLSNNVKESNNSIANIRLSKNLSSTENQNPCPIGSSVIETISISDDEDDLTTSSISDTNKKTDKCDKDKSKVGTIRVKNLGLLLDPAKTNNRSLLKNIANADPERSVTEKVVHNQGIPEKSVEDRFFDTYKLYFDEFVECNILKLGELLHLAVSDEIRRNERIKRAEQLSSLDLINEEKERANKDFNEMMFLRGKEFSPNFDLLLTRFEKLSKITLFFALFIRTFERASEIDSANSNHIFNARHVIHVMLTKYNSAHKDVCNVLICNPDEFMTQVHLITDLLRAFYAKCLTNSKEQDSKNKDSSKASSDVHNVTVNTSISTTNSGNTFTTNSLLTNKSTVPQIPTQQSVSSVHPISSRRNSSQRNCHKGFEMSGPPNVTISNSVNGARVLNPPTGLAPSPTSNQNAPCLASPTASNITISSILDKSSDQLVSNATVLRRSVITNNEVYTVSRNTNVMVTSVQTTTTSPLLQTTNSNNLSEQSVVVGRNPMNSEQSHLVGNKIELASTLGHPKAPKQPVNLSGRQLTVPEGLHSRLRASKIGPPVFQGNIMPRTQPVNIRYSPRSSFVSPPSIQTPNTIPGQSSARKSNQPYGPSKFSPLLSDMLQRTQTNLTSYENQRPMVTTSSFPKTTAFTNPMLENIQNSRLVESNISSHQMNPKLDSLPPPSLNAPRVAPATDLRLNTQVMSPQNKNESLRSTLATSATEINRSKPVGMSALRSPEANQINGFTSFQRRTPPTLTSSTSTFQANNLNSFPLRVPSLQTLSPDFPSTTVAHVPVTTPPFSLRESSLHTPTPPELSQVAPRQASTLNRYQQPVEFSTCPTSGGAPVNSYMYQQGQTQPSPTILTTRVVTSNLSSTSSRETSPYFQPDLMSATVEPVLDLPTASHCHPFIRRMPISGKMRMFFGNKY